MAGVRQKRSGKTEAFKIKALAASIGIAAKGHGSDEEVYAFAGRLADEVKANKAKRSSHLNKSLPRF